MMSYESRWGEGNTRKQREKAKIIVGKMYSIFRYLITKLNKINLLPFSILNRKLTISR